MNFRFRWGRWNYGKIQSNIEIICAIAKKIRLELEDNNLNTPNSRMLNISKPGRPEVKKRLQRKLEVIAEVKNDK